MYRILFGLSLALFMMAVTGFAQKDQVNKIGGSNMKLTSPAFENNKSIPMKYTGEGDDINPPLIIENIPEGTKSLALIADDPDAPIGTWVHWVVYDIPVISRIEEDTIPGKQGINDSKKDLTTVLIRRQARIAISLKYTRWIRC